MGRIRSRHGRTGMHEALKTLLLISVAGRLLLLPNWARSQEAECRHGHHRPGCAGAGSRRRPDQVESIAKGYQDPHFVEAKPSFLLKLRQADLLIVVGLQLEIGWLPPLITRAATRAFRSARPDTWTLRSLRKFWIFRRAPSPARWATCILWAIRTTGSIPTTDAASPRVFAGKLGELDPAECGVLPGALPGFRQAPDGGRAEVGCGHEARIAGAKS